MVDTLVLYRRLLGAQLRSQLQYRASFALDVAGAFLISFVDFLAVIVIFHNVPRLSVWSIHEVAFLYAMSAISFALTDVVIGYLDVFPQRIRDGSFDILLLRPRGTLFQVVTSELSLRKIGKLVQGAVVLVYALGGVDIDWNAGRAIVLALMVPSGALIFGAVWIAGSCLAFWSTEGGEFTNGFTYGGQFLAQYPVDIYGAWLRRFLAYLVPMAFVCYFPALYILGKDDPLGLPVVLQFLSPVVAVTSACLAGLMWRAAVRRYRSTGS